MSLVEVAALFRELDRLAPALPNLTTVPPFYGHGLSINELLCRQVIARADLLPRQNAPLNVKSVFAACSPICAPSCTVTARFCSQSRNH